MDVGSLLNAMIVQAPGSGNGHALVESPPPFSWRDFSAQMAASTFFVGVSDKFLNRNDRGLAARMTRPMLGFAGAAGIAAIALNRDILSDPFSSIDKLKHLGIGITGGILGGFMSKGYEGVIAPAVSRAMLAGGRLLMGRIGPVAVIAAPVLAFAVNQLAKAYLQHAGNALSGFIEHRSLSTLRGELDLLTSPAARRGTRNMLLFNFGTASSKLLTGNMPIVAPLLGMALGSSLEFGARVLMREEHASFGVELGQGIYNLSVFHVGNRVSEVATSGVKWAAGKARRPVAQKPRTKPPAAQTPSVQIQFPIGWVRLSDGTLSPAWRGFRPENQPWHLATPTDEKTLGGGETRPTTSDEITGRASEVDRLGLSDLRVRAFYEQASSELTAPLLHDTLIGLFGETSLHSPVADIVAMTDGHRLTYGDPRAFAADIAVAMQKRLDGRPVDVTNNPDGILNYDRIGDYSSGGEYANSQTPRKTWDALLSLVRSEPDAIQPLRPYLATRQIRIPQIRMATLNNETVSKLQRHAFMAHVLAATQEDIGEGRIEIDVVDQLGRLHADAPRLAQEIFAEMGWTVEIAKRTGGILSIRDKQGRECEDLNPEDVLLAFVKRSTSNHLGNAGVRDTFFAHVMTMAVAYLGSEHNPQADHFTTHFKALPELKRKANTQVYQKIYEEAQELITQGVMDYRLEGFTQKLTSYMRAQIAADLLNTPETLTDALSDIERQLAQTPREDGKKLGPLHLKKSKIEVERALSAFDQALQGVTSWREFQTALQTWESDRTTPAEARTRIDRLFGHLRKWSAGFLKDFDDFSLYFGKESEISDRVYDLELVPVTGLAAAIAIDSGSDCGAGQASRRAALAIYPVVMVTDPRYEVPYGYNGFFEASSNAEALLMIDALNPSTRLQMSSRHYVNEMRAYAESLADLAPLGAVLISSSPELASNRTGIQRAIKELGLPETGRRFGDIQDAIRTYEEGVEQRRQAIREEQQRHQQARLEAFLGTFDPFWQTLDHAYTRLEAIDFTGGAMERLIPEAAEDARRQLSDTIEDGRREIHDSRRYGEAGLEVFLEKDYLTPHQKIEAFMAGVEAVEKIAHMITSDCTRLKKSLFGQLSPLAKGLRQAAAEIQALCTEIASETERVRSAHQEAIRAEPDLAEDTETLHQVSVNASRIFYLKP